MYVRVRNTKDKVRRRRPEYPYNYTTCVTYFTVSAATTKLSAGGFEEEPTFWLSTVNVRLIDSSEKNRTIIHEPNGLMAE